MHSSMQSIIILTLHLSVCACPRVCVRAEDDQKPFNPIKGKISFFFSASLHLDVIIDSPLTRLAMAPAATEVSCFKRTVGQNYIEVYTYIRWPGEHKRAIFWSRCCPWVHSRRRRFYSKRLFLGALASEPAGQLIAFCS